MKTLVLQEYDYLIRVKDTHLVFSQGTQIFSNEKREVIEYPSLVCPFDKVVIQGDDYVSTRALQYLAEANVNVIMLDKQGRLFSHVNQILGSDPLLRQR